jgi:hypothetical protein
MIFYSAFSSLKFSSLLLLIFSSSTDFPLNSEDGGDRLHHVADEKELESHTPFGFQALKSHTPFGFSLRQVIHNFSIFHLMHPWHSIIQYAFRSKTDGENRLVAYGKTKNKMRESV